jgi:ribosome-associated toxin RatA of RatAB toxin-antitoxin module
MAAITRSALVGYNASQMYSLVENIESYPEFLPWCRSSEIIERREGATTARLSVGLKGISQSFTTENRNRPGESIAMRLVEGPFRSFSAAWRFHTLGEQASRIEFTMDYQLSAGLLAKVLGPLFDHIANTMVDAFHKRAQAVYGPPKH